VTTDDSASEEALMRMRIDRSIVHPRTSEAGTQRTSLDSMLGVNCPVVGRAEAAEPSIIVRWCTGVRTSKVIDK
jgi:hypothetical protein